MEDTRTRQLLGLGDYKPQNKYVCFLPFRGEFGWYIMTYVKRFHAFNHENKIACIKRGHECLFPSASHFYYNWTDLRDNQKAGIIQMQDEEALKSAVKKRFGTDDIFFSSPTDAGWDEKISLSGHTFEPKHKNNFGLQTDVVITPRFRLIDANRNFPKEYWQYIIDGLVAKGVKVGVTGCREATFSLKRATHYAYQYTDVDSDVEMMNKAKMIITQESGLFYLAMLCKRPIIMIGWYGHAEGSNYHRDLTIPFLNTSCDKDEVIKETLNFLANGKWEKK